MSDAAEAARNAAWREYQQRLSNLTEREESMLRTAYIAGWRACALANETPAPSPTEYFEESAEIPRAAWDKLT